MRIKIRKWRVFVNISWTEKIVFDKIYFLRSDANKKFEELRSKFLSNKERVVTMYKLKNENEQETILEK